MQLLSDICEETGLSIDDVHLILSDIRPDWATATKISNAEAQLIKDSVRAALPEGKAEIAQVPRMSLDKQKQLIENASQVLGLPLVLLAKQEIKMIEALQEVKNTVILNTIDRKQEELNNAIYARQQSNQQAYMTAIRDLADSLEKPVSTVKEMTDDIKTQNEQLEALLAEVKAGKW